MSTSSGTKKCLFLFAFAFLILSQIALPTNSLNAAPLQANAALTEWTVPTLGSGPWALTLDQGGRCCWFLEYYANKVGHLDPTTNTFQEWPIPTASANPYGLAVTAMSGSTVLWGTEFSSNKIFAMWPSLGVFREYSLPSSGSGVGYISVEPTKAEQVRVWFTETTKNRNGELIYDPATANVTLYEDAFPVAAGGGAYGVYAGSSSVWFAGFSALIRWDRPSQQYTIWPLPVHGLALGRSVSLDSKGDVWYTQGSGNATSDSNYVGVLRAGSTIEEWQLPSLGADPRGISLNPLTQQPWIAEQSSSVGNGSVAVLNNPISATLALPSATSAPSGGGPTVLGARPSSTIVSTRVVTPVTNPILGSSNGPFSEYALGPTLPHDCVVDSGGNIWVSEPGSNKIAKLSGFGADYALSSSPSVLSLSQGSSGTITITGTSISSFAGSVALSASGLPSGVTVSGFDPSSLSIPSGGNSSASVVINVAANAANGTSLVIFRGNNGTIDRATIIALTIVKNGQTSPGSAPRCLIATATYGSEVAPEVQLLRNFRDYSIMKTQAGSNFMVVFNAWYYSFSPGVANYLSTHWVERTIMKAILYPLIAILYLTSRLFSATSASPELAATSSGLFASSLLGAFYLGLPLSLIRARVRRFRRTRVPARSLSVALIAALVGLFLGEILVSPILMMVSSAVVVLSTMFLAALEASGRIARKFQVEP